MAKEDKRRNPQAAAASAKRPDLLVGVRHFVYASVGMWEVMREEAGTFYNKCVERGERTLQATRQEAHQRRVARRAARKPAHRSVMEAPLEAALARGGLATKAEFQALLTQVDALTREVDTLIAQRQMRP
jgi:polyhydroxyalkanoate synthesis regulator phasin